ncbi:UNVERIFIED_ORG: hypothetical protein M2348_001345 [Sphingomonas sp. R1F5B]
MAEQLLSVIVGGAIGLAGGLFGPTLTHFLKIREERRIERLRRIEDLCLNIYGHREWIHSCVRNVCAEQKCPAPLADTAKMYALGKLYFPDLTDSLDAVSSSSQEVLTWCLQMEFAKDAKEVASLHSQFDGKWDALIEALKRLLRKCETL